MDGISILTRSAVAPSSSPAIFGPLKRLGLSFLPSLGGFVCSQSVLRPLDLTRQSQLVSRPNLALQNPLWQVQEISVPGASELIEYLYSRDLLSLWIGCCAKLIRFYMNGFHIDSCLIVLQLGSRHTGPRR